MKTFLLFVACLGAAFGHAQELYPYTEPASNMPSHSLSAKLGAMYGRDSRAERIMQRYTPELMLGLNKKWMVHGAATFSDMYGNNVRGESVRLYAKYRFLSNDEVHKHFRMAAFAQASYSRNRPQYNELNIVGDQSGVQAGMIATQLLNKLAVSGTVSLTEVLHNERWKKGLQDLRAWRAFNYSLSTGYLLFPIQYTNYNQTNVNLYLELLGSRNLDFSPEKYVVDLAPSVQFIFSSTGKLNIGYRFQVAGDVNRLANQSVMLSYEHIFLNALRKKRKTAN